MTDNRLNEAAQAVRQAMADDGWIAALTGAGVSAESGIPTFRGAEGLWRGFRAEELATPEAFQRDPDNVWQWYMWRRGLVLDAQPNAAHKALAALERHHRGFTLVTQNVDGLHQRAGSERVVELHGNIHHARCLQCGRAARLPEPGDGDGPVRDGERTDMETPRCPQCDGSTRPHIVWFGETLPQQPWRQAHAAAASADVLLVIGTSAAVYPAAGLIDVTLAGGGRVIEINPQATDASERVTWALRGPAGDVLPELLQAGGVAPA